MATRFLTAMAVLKADPHVDPEKIAAIGYCWGGAVALNMALGPAGELIRLAGAEADRIRPRIETALHHALAEFAGPGGVVANSSTWIVTAQVPAAP